MLPFVRANEKHAEAVTKLVNSAYRGESGKQGWTTESDLLDGQRLDPDLFKDMLSPKSAILIFGDEIEPTACIYLERKADAAYIGMVTVSPTKQSSGFGSFILKTAEEFAASEWGLSVSVMTVISKRVELISWYQRRGYKDTGAKEPFPYGNERFGIPKSDDLEFVVLQKQLK